MKFNRVTAPFFISVPLFAFMLSWFLVSQAHGYAPVRAATRRQCEFARGDANMLVGLMLSRSSLDRDSVNGVYDYVLLEQRQCSLFTAPISLACHDDGCRAVELAIHNALMP